MKGLPRVAEQTRELIAREFDERGPASCVAQVTAELAENNPELLDIARRCARNTDDPQRTMMGFCMFYGLLLAEMSSHPPAPRSLPRATSPSHATHDTKAPSLPRLPRVSAQTRAQVLERIDLLGAASFTRQAIDELVRSNPELLQMAHNFASGQSDYLQLMQGFALLYVSLVLQCAHAPSSLH